MVECFWTDLVNAEQVCYYGDGDGAVLSLVPGSPSNCGGSPGWVAFGMAPEQQEGMSGDLATALTLASTVVITGLSQSSYTLDAWETFPYSLDDDVPGDVTFTDVEYEMPWDAGIWPSGGWKSGMLDGAYDPEYMQWFRVVVDGTPYYGITALGTSC